MAIVGSTLLRVFKSKIDWILPTRAEG